MVKKVSAKVLPLLFLSIISSLQDEAQEQKEDPVINASSMLPFSSSYFLEEDLHLPCRSSRIFRVQLHFSELVADPPNLMTNCGIR